VQIETNTTILDQFGWTFRVRSVAEDASRVLLLLHGWTGDENSMWVFTRNIPSSYAIIAPRAPYSAPEDKGGYSWREIKPGTWGSPTLDELHLAANSLVSLVDKWQDSVKITSSTFDIVGFSQGAALATTIAALYPSRVDKVAVLSGFIPPGVDSVLRPNRLDDVRFFWAHGTQDELIPVERGRMSIKLLEDAGANVHLCQADVGHKVGKDCRRALDTFLSSK
jgi:phospholipase/carboxylesterase